MSWKILNYKLQIMGEKEPSTCKEYSMKTTKQFGNLVMI